MLSVKSVVAVQMRKLHLNYDCMQRTGYYNQKKNFLFRLEAKMTRVGVGRWLLSNIWVAKLICVDVGLYIYTCVCAHTCVYVRVYFQNTTLARQERNGEKGLFFSVLLFVAHSPLTFCTELPFCSNPVSTLTRQGLISLG